MFDPDRRAPILRSPKTGGSGPCYAAKVRVKPEIPGNRHRNIHVSCLLQGQSTDRVALPAWVLAYRFRGSPYRAIVHRQRGDLVFGTSPTDWVKVMMLVLGIAAAVAAIVAAVIALR